MALLPVNVKVRVFPVPPAVTLVGLTVMVPSPLAAEPASLNVACAWEADPAAVR